MNSSRSFTDFLRTPWQVMSYGNCIVLACFATMFLLYGSILNTFTIFVDPLAEGLGTTRGGISAAMAFGAGGMALSAPFAGKLIDKIGAKLVMLGGCFVIGAGILLASRATEVWHIYIVYAFTGCGLAAGTIIPCSLIISNWFTSRRGMAMGIMAMGTSVGGMTMSPIANWIILNHGWRSAYVFSGMLILTLGLTTIKFLVWTRPSDIGMEPYVDPDLPVEKSDTDWGLTVKEAFATNTFWLIAILMFIIGLVTSGIGAHVVPCLKDFGHSPTDSTKVWTLTLAVMTVAKFAFGPIADRWGPKNAIVVSCAITAASILVLVFSASYSIALVFGVIYGFGVGAPLTVNSLLVGKTLGVKHFGAIFGILNLISIIGAAIGPVALGLVSDAKGSYLSGLYAFVILMALSGAVAVFIKSAADKFDTGLAQAAD